MACPSLGDHPNGKAVLLRSDVRSAAADCGVRVLNDPSIRRWMTQ
jgi:hypothetical protein